MTNDHAAVILNSGQVSLSYIKLEVKETLFHIGMINDCALQKAHRFLPFFVDPTGPFSPILLMALSEDEVCVRIAGDTSVSMSSSDSPAPAVVAFSSNASLIISSSSISLPVVQSFG